MLDSLLTIIITKTCIQHKTHLGIRSKLNTSVTILHMYTFLFLKVRKGSEKIA